MDVSGLEYEEKGEGGRKSFILQKQDEYQYSQVFFPDYATPYHDGHWNRSSGDA